MSVQIQLRRGTAADWTSNGSVVLSAGEPGFETDTGKFKVGDGTTQWNSLAYAGGLESLRLQDLSNVASTSPSVGEVLKWSGSAWAPAADATGGGGGGVTYTVSAETNGAGADLRLTGSDASTDNVTLAAGSNVTITRTDANTITIAAAGGGGGGSSTLAGLTDVDFTTPPANGEVLKYNSSSSKWESAADLTGGGGGSNQLTNGPHTFTLNNQGRIECADDNETNSRIHGGTYGPWLISSGLGNATELAWISAPVNSNAATIVDPATTYHSLAVTDTNVTIAIDSNNSGPVWVFNQSGTTSLPNFTLPAGDGTAGQALVTDGAGNVSWGSVGGGGGLSSRQSVNATTSIIADGASANATIVGAAKSYLLLTIQTDDAAWVRLYTDVASRTADSSRAEGVDPTPGSGVIAEVITTGPQTILISPGAIGFSNETSPTADIPIRVTNKSGVSTAITVTLQIVQLEA